MSYQIVGRPVPSLTTRRTTSVGYNWNMSGIFDFVRLGAISQERNEKLQK